VLTKTLEAQFMIVLVTNANCLAPARLVANLARHFACKWHACTQWQYKHLEHV